jgi:hypothetical protein
MAYPARVKGAALARLVTGETPGAVSRGMGLPYATVKRWQGEALGRFGKNGHQKKDGADLLGGRVGGYLDESLVTGRALLAELRDPAMLHQLNARELAYIHGGLFDRAFRMLGGLSQDFPECPQNEAAQ